jgi:hypothetical protein
MAFPFHLGLICAMFLYKDLSERLLYLIEEGNEPTEWPNVNIGR